MKEHISLSQWHGNCRRQARKYPYWQVSMPGPKKIPVRVLVLRFLFADQIKSPAYLFVGVSESLLKVSSDFELINVGNAFVYKRIANTQVLKQDKFNSATLKGHA